MRSPHDHLAFLDRDAHAALLLAAARQGGRIATMGASGSSPALTAAWLSRATPRLVVYVVAHLDEADDAAETITSLLCPGAAIRFPALEYLPGESRVSLELFTERVAVMRDLLGGWAEGRGAGANGVDAGSVRVLICPVQALMQAVPRPASLERLSLVVSKGERRAPESVVRWLEDAGYSRQDAVEEAGQFAVRGGILDVFPAGGAGLRATEGTGGAPPAGGPVRLDFFGDEVESIHEFDLDSMGSGARLARVEFVGASADAQGEDSGVSLLDLLPKDALAIVHETMEVIEQGRGYYERVSDARGVFGPPAVLKTLRERFHAFIEINQFSPGMGDARARIDLPARPLPEFARDAGDAVRELLTLSEQSSVEIFCQNNGEWARLQELLAEARGGGDRRASERLTSHVGYLHRGFVWSPDGEGGAEGSLALVPYHELLHRYETRRAVRRLRGGRAADAFIDLQPGDDVVHADHGVARFLGLKTMKPRLPRREGETDAEAEARRERQSGEEYLTLEFAAGAKLHVPATKIEVVQKYVGGFSGKPPLSTIGGKKWTHQKAKASESVRDLAAEMLRVQAARAAMPGVRYPSDTAWQTEFEAEFPFDETEDQLASLAEIKKDMQASRPMDRLICGDVGFGKTELAIRAAFKAVEFGKQVAILVPTTVLSEQHERTFKGRFADYPFRVEGLSRFKSTSEQNATLAKVRKGEVDVIIGTHRLLSKDVKFADLGLVVIDEEQRFGVEHKQALLALRMTVDVLTLSATPIPRTLHMAMLGLRDISSLTTAPLDRRAVVTESIPFNAKRIAAAIARELAREGQVFFVHNRVHNIRTVADEVQKLAPGARVVVGHGQMPDGELEDVMLRFMRRQADILVCTTIIESGIDIPTANTIFINDADRFGLADLHQLRGRVGRYKHRAYCYLLLPDDRPVTDIAQRRLRAIEEFSMLGAGFKIAMRDLEIRGAGNLLGPEQSGHIAAVGYDMYCRLLDKAVRELRGERVADPTETVIDVGLTGALPKTYIPSDSRRMEAYRRIARAATPAELAAVEKDLKDAYGEPPKQARRLLDLAELRALAAGLGVRAVVVREKDVVFRVEQSGAAAVAALLQGVKRATVRTLAAPIDEKGKPTGDGLAEVYFRPPESYLGEAESLVRVLRKRLGGD